MTKGDHELLENAARVMKGIDNRIAETFDLDERSRLRRIVVQADGVFFDLAQEFGVYEDAERIYRTTA